MDFYSCTQKQTKHKADPSVVELNNKIVPLVNHINNPDSCRRALLFLDNVTAIENNCFLCHYNKLMFQSQLKLYDGDRLLKQLYDSQTDEGFKEMAASFMNKSKIELI